VTPVPLSADVIVDRVKSNCSAFNDVFRAATSVTVAKQAAFRSPAAFVLEPAYTPSGTPDATGEMVQMITLEVGVLTGTRSLRDEFGGDNAAELEDARGQLWNALFGWTPEGIGTMPLQIGVCRPFGFEDGVFWYLDSFQLTRRLRGPQGG
jgi:hypothetical protein